MVLSRRAVVSSIGGMVPFFAFAAAMPQAQEDPLFGPAEDFPEDYVLNLARARAETPFQDEKVTLPQPLGDITYDQYRDIRFDPSRSVWKDTGSRFTFDLFHIGSLYKNPVDVYVIDGASQRRVNYLPGLFIFGSSVTPPAADAVLPFAGFRARYPINNPEIWDEFAVFLGASYFRAVGQDQIYGLSARGLAINTASSEGEEFPYFRAFWVRRPADGANALVVHALLDSPSTTGAYRFTLRPGATTLMDVEARLFPRTDLGHAGFAPLTSMFLFDSTNRDRFDDFRPAVHDSSGLQMLTGKGEWVWRPLANPAKLQISAFVDQGPQGFGLMQRTRGYGDFNDLEAHYERRPSLWVEPVGDWGAGHVELVEIPSDREINDNIVAYWRPQQPIAKGTEYALTYRLHWCKDWPADMPVARTVSTAQGLNWNQDARKFVVEFVGGDLSGEISATVSTGGGEIKNTVVQSNPETKGYRLKFELDPKGAELVELRAQLKRGETPVSEIWLYRWTA